MEPIDNSNKIPYFRPITSPSLPTVLPEPIVQDEESDNSCPTYSQMIARRPMRIRSVWPPAEPFPKDDTSNHRTRIFVKPENLEKKLPSRAEEEKLEQIRIAKHQKDLNELKEIQRAAFEKHQAKLQETQKLDEIRQAEAAAKAIKILEGTQVSESRKLLRKKLSDEKDSENERAQIAALKFQELEMEAERKHNEILKKRSEDEKWKY